MRNRFLSELQTPAVAAAQTRAYGRSRVVPASPDPRGLGPDERAFIAARDSFYLASQGESGWPYVQHRGGPPGFLQVVDERHLVFADLPGNRQLITTGNVSTSPKVCLFLMDYVARERLKILGLARVLVGEEAATWAERLSTPEMPRPERVFFLEVVGFDWNCPQHITPRFTQEMVVEAVAPLRARIAELEHRLGLPPSEF